MNRWNLLLLAGLALAPMAQAQQATQDTAKPGQGESGREPRRPPLEALAACKSLASGAACSFTSPRGPESGSCWAPEGRPLACRPQHDAQGPGAGPRAKPKS